MFLGGPVMWSEDGDDRKPNSGKPGPYDEYFANKAREESLRAANAAYIAQVQLYAASCIAEVVFVAAGGAVVVAALLLVSWLLPSLSTALVQSIAFVVVVVVMPSTSAMHCI